MPKRIGYIYNEIYSWQNLVLAYKKARKHKRSKDEVAEFEYNLENNLLDIQEQLLRQNYKFSGYKYFIIKEPKERLICCAPFKDRVVHHAICNILEPILDRSMIADTYACRKGKGLHHAVRRAFWMYQQCEYVYKFDIRKYFYSIDHEMLMQKLKRKIKDTHLIVLLEDLLDTYNYHDIVIPEQSGILNVSDSSLQAFDRKAQRDDVGHSEKFFCEQSNEESQLLIPFYIPSKGLPIGNLTSQIFANYFLNDFDHFCKENLHCRYYIRYMDDILIFHSSKDELKNTQYIIERKLNDIKLQVHPDKNQIHKTKQGVNFLGFRFKGDQIRLQNRNLVRFKRKLRKYSEHKTEIREMLLSFNGHLGYFNSGHCKKIIGNILTKYEFFDGMKKFRLAI